MVTEKVIQRYFVKKRFLKISQNLQVKHLCQSLFFNEIAGLRSATSFKKRLWHRFFPVNFVNIPRTPFLQNSSSGCICSHEGWLISLFPIIRSCKTRKCPVLVEQGGVLKNSEIHLKRLHNPPREMFKYGVFLVRIFLHSD